MGATSGVSSSAPGGEARTRRALLPALCKAAVLFITLAGIVVIAHALDISGLLDKSWADAYLRKSGLYGVFLFMGLVLLLCPLGVPRQALSALAGYAFGAFWGSIWTSIALMGACACSFFYARLLARDVLQKRFGGWVKKLDAFLSHKPFLMSIALRLFPIGNNALTSLAAGVTSIPSLPFIAGSGLGYMPQTIIFALLGSGISVEPSLRIGVSAVLFIAATLMGLGLYKSFRGRSLDTPQKGNGGTE